MDTKCAKILILAKHMTSNGNINKNANSLSNILHTLQTKLGKMVKHDASWSKTWPNPNILNPILKTRIQARQWMISAKLDEAASCYKEWNQYLCGIFRDMKTKHWNSYLQSSNQYSTFQSLKCVKMSSSGQVLPLKRPDGSIDMGKEEKAEMCFQGTSPIQTNIDSCGIYPIDTCMVEIHEEITLGEIKVVIDQLATKKAPGPDKNLNELLKLICPALQTHLHLFNRILHQGTHPSSWKLATTVIIRKANKLDYTSEGAYCPIALLNLLVKAFELILEQKLVEWDQELGALLL